MQKTLRLCGHVSLAPEHRLAHPCFFDQRIRQVRREALKGLASSTSVPSDSQDSVGVSPGFHFFDDHPSRRLCESQSLKQFFNFLVVLLTCSFVFSSHDHGSIHGTVQRFSFHHCDMLYHAWALTGVFVRACGAHRRRNKPLKKR